MTNNLFYTMEGTGIHITIEGGGRYKLMTTRRTSLNQYVMRKMNYVLCSHFFPTCLTKSSILIWFLDRSSPLCLETVIPIKESKKRDGSW